VAAMDEDSALDEGVAKAMQRKMHDLLPK
jgi:hypothetical protein